MLARKQIKELKDKVAALSDKLEDKMDKLEEVSSENFKYKRLFSKLFTRLQLVNAIKYEVNNNLTDGLATLNIEYDDGTSYTYEVKLVSMGYKEGLKNEEGKSRVGRCRQHCTRYASSGVRADRKCGARCGVRH